MFVVQFEKLFLHLPAKTEVNPENLRIFGLEAVV
jgi:hypothetical protein